MALKAAVFIDGPNFWASCVALKVKADYVGLKKYFANAYAYESTVFNFYTAVHTDDTGFQKIKPVIDMLAYNGYRVVQKPVKVISRGENQDALMKGNLDVEIAVDMIMSAQHCDVLMLFSGDGDFAYVIDKLRQMGKQVYVFSNIGSGGSDINLASDEIRRAANVFIDMGDERMLENLPFLQRNNHESK